MARHDLVTRVQDLTSLSWSERASSSGTAGTYLKARTGTGSRALYYKLSRFNGLEVDGYECVYELVASRLMEVLGIEHVAYRLVHARVVIDGVEHVTWVNTSRSFRLPGERKLALGAFFELYRIDDETPYELCRRFGWEDDIRRTMLVDFLVANRDRHSSNIEVLVARDGTRRLSPVFDTGFSLLAPLAGDEERIRSFDTLADVATTNFVGSRSLEKNLELVGRVPLARDLVAGDRGHIMSGLDRALPPYHLEKVWEIVWRRWERYADVRDS